MLERDGPTNARLILLYPANTSTHPTPLSAASAFIPFSTSLFDLPLFSFFWGFHLFSRSFGASVFYSCSVLISDSLSSSTLMHSCLLKSKTVKMEYKMV